MSIVRILTSPRPLTEITGFFFLAHAALTVCAAGILGPSAFLSWSGLALLVVFDCLIWISLRSVNGRAAPIQLTTAWFVLLFFLPRLTAFQIFPASNVTFVALQPFTQEEVFRGLAYIAAGYATLCVGLRIGVRICPAIKARPVAHLTVGGIVVYAILAGAATIYVTYFLQVSIYSPNPENWGARSGWVAIVLNPDIALVAAITWLVLNPSEVGNKRIIALLIVAGWLALSLVTGSRGGALRVMLIIGLAAIAIYGNPVTSVFRVLVIVTVSFVASSILYPIGTYVRFVPASGENAMDALADYWFRVGPAEERGDASTMRLLWAKSEGASTFASLTSPVITRLGLVDYPIVIVNRTPDLSTVDRYLAVSYGLKNFVNNLVPGEVFSGYDIMTSRIFNMAYRGYSEQHIRSYFLSEPWTLWGYSWLKGGFIGGIALIFSMSIAMQIGYELVKYAGTWVSYYGAVTYLFIPVIGGFLQFFGLDHAMTVTAHFTLALAAMFIIAVVIEWVSDKTRKKRDTRSQNSGNDI
jgi:hypothetical protein